eukprot:3113719-Amphidinium_carterae.1
MALHPMLMARLKIKDIAELACHLLSIEFSPHLQMLQGCQLLHNQDKLADLPGLQRCGQLTDYQLVVHNPQMVA